MKYREKLIKLINKTKSDLDFAKKTYEDGDDDGLVGYLTYLVKELESINASINEQPSEGLEEAATALTNEIVGELNAGDYTDHSGHNAHWYSFKEGVVAGANWQKKQIIGKACEWICNNFKCAGYSMPLYYKGVHYSPQDISNDFKKAMEQC